ncbi:MAG: excalibur calcium-binding domain-containing protein, partial [Chloroflexota bacterium]
AGTSTAESIVQLTEAVNATKDANSTATATLWTNTPTMTPSTTPSPTITPTTTNTLPPTNTPTITPTRPTSTPTQTNTPRPVTYYSTGDANVRSCTQIAQCPVVGAVSRNDEIQVIGTTDGDNFNGSDTWRIIIFEGEIAYIHDELVSRTELPDLPTAAPVSVQSQPVNTAVPASNTSNTSNSSSGSGNTSSSQTNTTRPANCTEARAMGLSAVEAAQWSHLDRDGDGVACYGD